MTINALEIYAVENQNNTNLLQDITSIVLHEILVH